MPAALRTLLFASAVAIAAATPARANDITVGAGEHQGHSRIVVPANAGVVVVEEDGRRLSLDFRSGQTAIDLSAIVDKKKARRVRGASLTPTEQGARVDLSLACACRIVQERLPDGRLVVDIFDAAPVQTAAAGAAAAPAPGPEGETPAPRQASAADAPAKPQAAAHTQTHTDEIDVDEARSRMIALLQQAANDGLVKVKPDAPELTRPVPPAPAEKPAAPQESAAKSADAARPNAPAPTLACLPDGAFRIDAEADANPLAAISRRQSALAGAAVGDEHEFAMALAGAYLAVGFGDEALATLAEYGAGNSLEAEMARVVAERALTPTSFIIGAEDCRGAHALWQAAAAAPERSARAAARAGDAIETLPPRLRTLIAARIAQKAAEAGAWNEARRYYSSGIRAAGSPTPELQLVAARILDHEGADAESAKLLSELASANSDTAKDALLALADRYAASGERPPEGFVDDLGALARTDRGVARGGEAAFREALLWAEEGNIEASVLLLRSAADSAPETGARAAAKARELIAAAFARGGDDASAAAALSAYLDNRAFVDAGGADPKFVTQAAEKARALGVPNVAVALAPAAGEGRDGALLRARAHLDANMPEKALEIAAPFADDQDFAALVVEANMRLERNFAALAAASAIADPQEKARRMADAAWRAGDWASAFRAFHRIDPNQMSAEAAERFALSAFMAGEKSMPAAAEAVLRREKSAAFDGLSRLFGAGAAGTIVERGKASVGSATDEIRMIEEILGNG